MAIICPFDKPSAKYNVHMDEKHEVRASIVFYGEPRWIPKPGEKVELHVADGSWQGGFRCFQRTVRSRTREGGVGSARKSTGRLFVKAICPLATLGPSRRWR